MHTLADPAALLARHTAAHPVAAARAAAIAAAAGAAGAAGATTAAAAGAAVPTYVATRLD